MNVVKSNVGVAVGTQAKGEAVMNSSNTEARRRNGLAGFGLLSFVSLLAVLVFTGTAALGDESEAKLYLDIKTGETAKPDWQRQALIKDEDRVKSIDLLTTSPNEEKAKQFVERFIQKNDGSGRNEFVALAQNLISVAKQISIDKEADPAKATEQLLTLRELLNRLPDEVFGKHRVKDGEGKWKMVGNAIALKDLFRKILNMSPSDLKDKSDLELLKIALLSNKDLKDALGLKDKPPTSNAGKDKDKDKDKDGDVEITPPGGKDAGKDKDKDKDKDAPKPTGVTEPPQPPRPPVGGPGEQPGAGAAQNCAGAQNNGGLDGLMRALLSMLTPALQANQRPQIDPQLAALADRVAPEQTQPTTATPIQPQPPQLAQGNNGRGNDSNFDQPLNPQAPQQPDEPQVQLPELPTPTAALSGAINTKPFAEGQADAEISSASNYMKGAKSLLKKLTRQSDNVGPLVIRKGPNGAKDPSPLLNGVADLARVESKANAEADRYGAAAEQAKAKSDAILAAIKKTSPEYQVLDAEQNQLKKLKDELAAAKSDQQKQLSAANGAGPNGAKQIKNFAQNDVGNLIKQIEKNITDQEARVAAAKEKFEKTDAVAARDNAQKLAEYSTKLTSYQEELEGVADSAAKKARDGQAQAFASLNEGDAQAPKNAPVQGINAQRLLSPGPGASPAASPRLGPAQGASGGQQGGSIRGRLGPNGANDR